MTEREVRHDAGVPMQPIVEDCAFCGAEVTLSGSCSAHCEASRRKKKKDSARVERVG